MHSTTPAAPSVYTKTGLSGLPYGCMETYLKYMYLDLDQDMYERRQTLILWIIRKIWQDQATDLLLWTAQPWYPVLMQHLIAHPCILPEGWKLLHLPEKPNKDHRLQGKLQLLQATCYEIHPKSSTIRTSCRHCTLSLEASYHQAVQTLPHQVDSILWWKTDWFHSFICFSGVEFSYNIVSFRIRL